MVKCMHLTTHTHLWTNSTCVKHDEQYYVVLMMLNKTHTEVRYQSYIGIRPVILYKIKMYYIDVSSSFIRLPNTFTSMLSTYVAFVVFINLLYMEKFPILFWYVTIAVCGLFSASKKYWFHKKMKFVSFHVFPRQLEKK